MMQNSMTTLYGSDRELDCSGITGFIPVKSIKKRLTLRDHHFQANSGVSSIRSRVFVQDEDTTSPISLDLRHFVAVDVYCYDQSIIVWEVHCIGILLREEDEPTSGEGGHVNTAG